MAQALKAIPPPSAQPAAKPGIEKYRHGRARVTMDGLIKTYVRRVLLLSACSVCALVLVSLGFSYGVISPRGLGIALATLGAAIVYCLLLIARKTAKQLRVPAGMSMDAATRGWGRRLVRVLKIWIVVLALSLAYSFSQDMPVSSRLVGIAINLCLVAAGIQTIVRLQKRLR